MLVDDPFDEQANPPRGERRVVDVMLAVGDTADAPDDEPTPRALHFDKVVDFGHGVGIGRVHALRNDAILDALERRGLNWTPGTRQYGSLYGLVRHDPPTNGHEYHVDPDRRLSTAAAILRLVRPHAMSLRHSARIIMGPSDKIRIIPSDPFGPGSAAFVVDEAHQWIRDQDVVDGRALFDVFMREQTTLPERVGHAIYAHEMIHWQRSVDVRWSLLAMALEGLVHTDERDRRNAMKNRAQFVARWGKLASCIPGISLTPNQFNELYDHRSHTMHGGHIGDLESRSEFTPLYRDAENALRLVIRAALLRPPIRDIFRDDDSVRTYLGFANESGC